MLCGGAEDLENVRLFCRKGKVAEAEGGKTPGQWGIARGARKHKGSPDAGLPKVLPAPLSQGVLHKLLLPFLCKIKDQDQGQDPKATASCMLMPADQVVQCAKELPTSC